MLRDSVMSWRLLNIGGLLIWDDVNLRKDNPSAAERPADAIEAVVRLYSGAFTKLDSRYQLIVRKTADFPTFDERQVTKPKKKRRRIWDRIKRRIRGRMKLGTRHPSQPARS